MPLTNEPRLLLKVGPLTPAALAAVKIKIAAVQFKLQPLFENLTLQAAAAAAPQPAWYLAQAAAESDEGNAWDLAHSVLVEGLGVAGAPAVAYAEPDLLQSWPYENATPLVRPGQAFAEAELCQFHDQRGDPLPSGPGFAWHLKDEFSQLKSARDSVGPVASPVRVAHFDTGYDPAHATCPQCLRRDLQHNFVDTDRPDDASDPAVRGTMKNPGHGTATLAILAGNRVEILGDYLGGAPMAEVVPVRVANSVVLFYTSAIAKAFDWALAPKGDPRNRCDVISMSMGGVASAAWTEAVNRCYEAGITIVTAAGNSYGGYPTRNIVYPARYQRVIAVCGMMADGRPYFNLPIEIMEGNFGPASKMSTAMAAYTPNVPWAELGCGQLVDMDGQGTSAATPQIAGAAALWLLKHHPSYDEPWKRVEAVRRALFTSARKDNSADFGKYFGNGALRAKDALEVQPATDLVKTPQDSASFPFLRVLTGLGVAQDGRAGMYELEIVQLTQKSKTLEEIIPDPHVAADQIPPKDRQRFLEAVVAEPGCSKALREYLGRHYVTEERIQVPVASGVQPAAAADSGKLRAIAAPLPAFRELRTYAFDPSLGMQLDTAVLNGATLKVPWEHTSTNANLLEPGPVGEYLEVVDYDPASRCFYAPVDLNDPFLLAQDGLAPSEGNPQFHQQMVYAVAMTTIRNFEQALGRVALWSPRHKMDDKFIDAFVPRLRIYPHALREANAFYSPDRKALLFGYFPASTTSPGNNLPGGIVFTCLSHDVVAHETTHALLDGLHRRFAEPSNQDVLAFHEAFADIVALFQHFTFPEALRHQIAKTRGDLARQNILGELAQQFGQAIGNYGALRDAIGTVDPVTRQWKPVTPDPTDYQTVTEPHARGAILVGAVFDAFLAIYKSRIADLLRIATAGTGVLPEGDIHPDLVNRLAREATRAAQHVLGMCIRALDYCPPVDMTFGEYLRALVTADWDLVPDDDLGYRIAFIEAFRRRGIYPNDVRTLAAESLRWQPPSAILEGLPKLLNELKLDWDLTVGREQAFEISNKNRFRMHEWLVSGALKPADAWQMGLALGDDAPPSIPRKNGKPLVEVHSVRPARRVGPDGQLMTDLVAEITQRREEPVAPENPGFGNLTFRGGCTLLIDLETALVRYCVAKSITSEDRLSRQRKFLGYPSQQSLYATYFGMEAQAGEPFAMLHRGLD